MSALVTASTASTSPTRSPRRLARLSAVACLLGVVLLIVSYNLYPGVPDHPTAAQLMAFGAAYHTQIVTGAWLQAVGTTLIIAFSLAIVHLAGATSRYAGWLTFFGGLILVMTSLTETAFYLVAGYATEATTGFIGLDLISAVQHLYFIVAAPAVFLPLGAVILASRPLPGVFGYLAYLLGAAFALLGIVGLYTPDQTVGDILASAQGVWWLVAAIILLVRPGAPSVPAEATQSRLYDA